MADPSLEHSNENDRKRELKENKNFTSGRNKEKDNGNIKTVLGNGNSNNKNLIEKSEVNENTRENDKKAHSKIPIIRIKTGPVIQREDKGEGQDNSHKQMHTGQPVIQQRDKGEGQDNSYEQPLIKSDGKLNGNSQPPLSSRDSKPLENFDLDRSTQENITRNDEFHHEKMPNDPTGSFKYPPSRYGQSLVPSNDQNDFSENCENLLLFKNKVDQTVEKNSQLTSSEKMADNEVQRNFKPPQLGQKPPETSNLSIETSEINEQDNYPEVLEIQPISSVTNTHQSFRRIYDSVVESQDARYDPLMELRNIARLEADNFKDSLEETYFSPPVSPTKHPLQYLKKAVYKEENYLAPEPRQKIRKTVKETSYDNEYSELADIEQNVMNDFDESIFKYNPETKLFACPWEGCGKSFPSLSRIKRHYIIHTKLKPFKCLNKGCMRRFSRKDNMLQHYRVHCPFAHKKST